MSIRREVVRMSDVPDKALREVLDGVLSHLGLEIVRETAEDMPEPSYEVRAGIEPTHPLDAKAMGSRGAAARNKKLTPDRRSEIAKAAAKKRWQPLS